MPVRRPEGPRLSQRDAIRRKVGRASPTTAQRRDEHWAVSAVGAPNIGERRMAAKNPAGYERWLGLEPDPHDLLVPFPSEPMTIWPISRRVNSPDNDDERLLEEISPPVDIAV